MPTLGQYLSIINKISFMEKYKKNKNETNQIKNNRNSSQLFLSLILFIHLCSFLFQFKRQQQQQKNYPISRFTLALTLNAISHCSGATLLFNQLPPTHCLPCYLGCEAKTKKPKKCYVQHRTCAGS